MKIRESVFDFSGHTYVMGILNVTPDSFSDGGLHNTPQRAVDHALRMVSEGAAIIDVGGESTRPGYEPVPADVEKKRVIPVIEAIRRASSVPISIDTTKPLVAEAALAAGADIVNSVSGLATDDEMIKVVKEFDVPFIMTYEKSYVNQFGEALIGMAERVIEAGIKEEKIILDPGIGFGKTYEENLRILNELPLITQTGYPILLACSRKSVIKQACSAPDIRDRLSGTIVATTLAALAGVGIVRVHDVADNVRAIKMLRAVCNVPETDQEKPR